SGKAAPGQPTPYAQYGDPYWQHGTPVRSIKYVAGLQDGTAPGVERPICYVDQPDCQRQQYGRKHAELSMKTANEKELPQQCHDGGVQAQQVRPQPRPGMHNPIMNPVTN